MDVLERVRKLAQTGFIVPYDVDPLILLTSADVNFHDYVSFVLCRFSPEAASRRGLSTAEMNAVEAIHRAVEFNPHVPKVSVVLCSSATVSM